jgi:hypothetical protein
VMVNVGVRVGVGEAIGVSVGVAVSLAVVEGVGVIVRVRVRSEGYRAVYNILGSRDTRHSPIAFTINGYFITKARSMGLLTN